MFARPSIEQSLRAAQSPGTRPPGQTLTALERTDRGYVIALVAGPGDLVRAAPFDLVEIPISELFIDEQDDLPAAAPPNE